MTPSSSPWSGLMMLMLVLGCGEHLQAQSFTRDGYEEQVIRFRPTQGELPKADYDHGAFVLGEVRARVGNDPKKFDVVDYFNTLSAFLTLKLDQASIVTAFEEFKDSPGSCEYLTSPIIFQGAKYNVIRASIDAGIAACGEQAAPAPVVLQQGVDVDLLMCLVDIEERDSRHRNAAEVDWTQQTPLDLRNQQVIDSLYSVHQRYIGRTLAGDDHAEVMWLVVQHSNPGMMERYLPVIHQAVIDGELPQAPLTMLIDRLYGLKYGYQVFGSQGPGLRLADEERRAAVKAEFGIK